MTSISSVQHGSSASGSTRSKYSELVGLMVVVGDSVLGEAVVVVGDTLVGDALVGDALVGDALVGVTVSTISVDVGTVVVGCGVGVAVGSDAWPVGSSIIIK